MLAGVFVIIIVLGFVAHRYLKGTALKSFAVVIAAICGAVIAFSYFELIASAFIKRGRGGQWAHAGSFLLLFIVSFAILRFIAGKLIRGDIDLGLLVTRCVNIICGFFLGLILAGVILTTAALAPLSEKWPYQRFQTDAKQIDPRNPRKVLLNADGFVAGLFRIISKGSLSSDRSFAVFHPNFLDQAYLNRHKITGNILAIAADDAVVVRKKNGAWQAPANLIAASTAEPLQPKPHHSFTIVRVGLKSGAAEDGGIMGKGGSAVFTLAQLRLICKQKATGEDIFTGTAQAVYPVGYIRTGNQVQLKNVSDDIVLKHSDFAGKTKYIDFVFEVPQGYVPVIVRFRQNALAQVPPLMSPKEAPEMISFIQTSKCATELAEVKPVTRAKTYGLELTARKRLLQEFSLPITSIEEWQRAEQPILGIQTLLGGPEGNKIVYARTALAPPEQEPSRQPSDDDDDEDEGLADLLQPLEGYKLLSLRCSPPGRLGSEITADSLPVLMDLAGRTHYPVGLLAAGKAAEQTIYQVDYCALRAQDIDGGLVIAADGSVANPFPELWLAEQVDNITELYVLYLVEESSPRVIITSVRPADSRVGAGFKKYEGFVVQ